MKPLLSSWTFWFGVAQIVLSALGFLGGIMTPDAALSLLLTGLGSIGFRLKTTTAIGSIT